MRANQIVGEFEGFFERAKTFLTPNIFHSASEVQMLLLHNVAAHNVNSTGRVCYLT
jgi:hypothetical protein